MILNLTGKKVVDDSVTFADETELTAKIEKVLKLDGMPTIEDLDKLSPTVEKIIYEHFGAIYEEDTDDDLAELSNITGYLIDGPAVVVQRILGGLAYMGDVYFPVYVDGEYLGMVHHI